MRCGINRTTILVVGALLIACGGETRRSDADGETTGGRGGATGSGSGSSTRGSGVSTTNGVSTVTTTGFGGTGGAPGTACFRPNHRVDGCVEYLEGSAGEGGLGARGPFPDFDECPAGEFGACEQRLSGRVTAVGATESWCDAPRILWTTPRDSLGEHRIIQLSNDDTEVGYDMAVVFGPVVNELDVDVGDELVVTLERGSYHAGFMYGSRITVMRDNELVAVVNDEYPVDEPTNIGVLDFERGERLCENPEDDFSCSYAAHSLDVTRYGETVSIVPGGEAVLDPFEIVVDENFAVEDGGACDTGDTSRYGAFRARGYDR